MWCIIQSAYTKCLVIISLDFAHTSSQVWIAFCIRMHIRMHIRISKVPEWPWFRRVQLLTTWALLRLHSRSRSIGAEPPTINTTDEPCSPCSGARAWQKFTWFQLHKPSESATVMCSLELEVELRCCRLHDPNDWHARQEQHICKCTAQTGMVMINKLSLHACMTPAARFQAAGLLIFSISAPHPWLRTVPHSPSSTRLIKAC